MRVALIDVDSHNFSNLVLMKLSAWYKTLGDEITLMSAETALQEENLIFKYDKIYGACVFSGHEEILRALELCGAHLGGTGTRYIRNFQRKNPSTLAEGLLLWLE